LKKRLYLITALVLALILSGGVYAYTFTTASDTISIAEPTADIATVNATAIQPDWESVLTPVADTEILRPMAAGDETNISDQEPALGAHWDKVDEATADGDTTYVYTSKLAWEEDLYHIADHSLGLGTIIYVKVYMVCRALATPAQTSAYVHIKTGGIEYNGSEEMVTISYAAYSYQWDTNPQTGASWTWSEIDALQIGVGLRRSAPGQETRCTQVYAEVGYEYIPLTGNVPTGDLFVITPHPNYTADLAVKVYLVNTGNLTKAYQYLNMKLYLKGSVEASQTPDYRLLTLHNGVATFNLKDYAPGSYTLSVIGGSYCLVSIDPSEWSPGWTVTPELYCEVTQR